MKIIDFIFSTTQKQKQIDYNELFGEKWTIYMNKKKKQNLKRKISFIDFYCSHIAGMELRHISNSAKFKSLENFLSSFFLLSCL